MSYIRSLQQRGHGALDQFEPLIPDYVTPNRLSWSRVWGTPIIWGAYLSHPLLGFLVYAVLCLTDWLDGYLAKKRGLHTKYGKKLDERTDKVLMIGVVALLFADQVIPLDPQAPLFWMVAILVLRDSLMTTMRELWPEIAEEVPSLILAKLKTFTAMPALGLMMFANLSGVSVIPNIVWETLFGVGFALMAVSVLLSLVSFVQYAYLFGRRVFKQH